MQQIFLISLVFAVAFAQAAPTARPTTRPTATPTATPTAALTATPTAAPTAAPTARPTATPTAAPTAADSSCYPKPDYIDQAPCSIKAAAYQCLAKSPKGVLPLPCPVQAACSDGEYCPLFPLSDPVRPHFPCPGGGYCPPKGMYLNGTNYFNWNGTSCVLMCPGGYYCPGGGHLVECPANHYCREGSNEPTPCSVGDFCDVGTKLTETRGQLIALIVSCGCIAIALGISFLQFLKRMWESKFLGEWDLKLSNIDELRDVADPLFAGFSSHEIGVSASGLTLTLKEDGKKILDDVSFQIQPGTVTAIMGPSGSGKTSLMSVLSGKAWSYGIVTGDVQIGGLPLARSTIEALKPVLGFVPQEDVMTRQCTILEVLRFQANLRLPTSCTHQEKSEKVNHTIQSLQLVKIASSVIGDEKKRGISGGQRKRVNVAMEVVANPSILFLDEPTSGLDSTTSKVLCDYLKQLSTGGVTVIAVIHQPRYEIFCMFDNVVLLAPGGRLVYCGATAAMQDHFDKFGFSRPTPHMNVADYYMDTISTDAAFFPDSEREKVGKMIRHQRNAFRKPVNVAPLRMDRTLVPFTHMLMLSLQRCILLQYRRQKLAVFSEAVICMIGISMLSYALPYTNFIELRNHFALGALLFTLLTHFAVLPCFASDARAVASREFACGLSVLAHFMAKDISQLPRFIMYPLIFCFQYAVVDPHMTLWQFLQCYLGLSYATIGSGLMLSAMFPDVTAQMGAVLLGFVFLMIGGYNPGLNTVWNAFGEIKIAGQMLTALSPIRWFFELMSNAEYNRSSEMVQNCANPLVWGNGLDPKSGGFESVRFNLVALFGIGVLFRVIALAKELHRAHSEQREVGWLSKVSKLLRCHPTRK